MNKYCLEKQNVRLEQTGETDRAYIALIKINGVITTKETFIKKMGNKEKDFMNTIKEILIALKNMKANGIKFTIKEAK